MLQTLRRLQKRQDGATAVEYVLLVVAIALIMVVGAFALGGTLKDKFTNTSTCIGTGTSAGCDAVTP